ncbi:hypothetical protein PIB30_061077 [Stylosanthes scabra]|uniref:Uncharacterized protein n=1 Tax=Stylosanthes scabra TaxID=79078 RepID=A0ABU6ZJF3_9FABA|nr:hypothetical protein [Stylosanthes scabra]
MPKKAIVASSRSKGIRLALPGPIKQNQSGYESFALAVGNRVSGIIFYEYEKHEKFEDYDMRADAELGTRSAILRLDG